MYPPADFVALVTIERNNQRIFNPGDELYADQVNNLGLVVGEQVAPLRAADVARPARNAKRDAWESYALGVLAARGELDDAARDRIGNASRDKLVAEFGASSPDGDSSGVEHSDDAVAVQVADLNATADDDTE